MVNVSLMAMTSSSKYAAGVDYTQINIILKKRCCQWPQWSTLSSEYLEHLLNKFIIMTMGLPGARGKLCHELQKGKNCCHWPFKGTQAWEFFGLRYWNLYFFVVSYAEMLRFRLKKKFVGPLLGEIGLFCVYWDYAEWKKNFKLGNIFCYFSSLKCPLYICW